MKSFPCYEKIAESLGRWHLEPSAYRLLQKAEWVVTEKIHGANFCIATDGATVRCANRRTWLLPGEVFFGYEAVRETTEPKIRELFRHIHAKLPETVRLFLYGELFGGGYPHPDLTPVPGVQPVQTGIWYAPDIRFCAFDLRVENTSGEHHYRDYAEVVKLCADTGIFFAAPLFVGKYEGATEQDIRFDSTIPRSLGLPPLPTGSNPAEGVVIKPYREIPHMTVQGETIRPVLKRKIAEFAEDKRYHKAAKWTKPVAPAVLPLDLLQWEASCRIVENRRDAAASKIGYVSRKTPDKSSHLFRLLADEVLEETREAMPEVWASLSESEREKLQDFVAAEVRLLLKTEER